MTSCSAFGFVDTVIIDTDHVLIVSVLCVSPTILLVDTALRIRVCLPAVVRYQVFSGFVDTYNSIPVVSSHRMSKTSIVDTVLSFWVR